MTNEILAFGAPGGLEWIIIVCISLILFVLPVLVVVWMIRSLVRNKRENQRLRLEVGKLADELERMRKKNEAEGTESG